MSRAVTLYRKEGCSLCDEAEWELARLAPGLDFTVEAVDIEADAGLHARYWAEIPVVVLGDVVVARAPIRAEALEARLREALG